MITDENLKKIIEEVIGNNDPYWNMPVFDIIKKVIDLRAETTTTIADLINYNPNETFVEPMMQGQIRKLVEETCKRLKIELEENRDSFGGLAYYYQFKKINSKKEKETSLPKCPVCDGFLTRLMPDGATLYCNKCEKYYKNDNGNVGEETTSPYIRNDVLY